MQTITLPQIEIDNSILLSLKASSDTAIALYQKRQLSLGKFAQIRWYTDITRIYISIKKFYLNFKLRIKIF